MNYVETEMKSCEEEECKLLYVRSMGNAGLAKFLPSLLNQALNSKSSTVSLTAIQGLRRMKISDFKDQVVTIYKCSIHFAYLDKNNFDRKQQ